MVSDGNAAPPIVRPVSPAGIADLSASDARADRQPVVIDLPAAARPPGPITLGGMVRMAVNEVLDRSVGGSVSDDGVRDDASPDQDDAMATDGVEEAVVRAHEQRIAVLRARLDAARAGGAMPRLLADMSQRLARAEAARRLAAARIGGVVAAADCGGDGAAASCRPPVSVAASKDAQAAARPNRRIAASAAVAAARRAWVASRADPGRAVVARTVHAVIGGVSVQRRIVGRVRPAGLVKARRSLVAARRSLDAGAPPRAGTAPTVTATLWHWAGSASWSLTADRPSAS